MEREGGWDEEVGSILERRVNGLILEGRAGVERDEYSTITLEFLHLILTI